MIRKFRKGAGFAAAVAVAAIVIALGTACGGRASRGASGDYAIRPVSFEDVDITDSFWAPKLEVNRTVSIFHCYDQWDKTGDLPTPRIFEGAAAMLLKRDDPELRRRTDGYFEQVLAKARLTEPRGEAGIGISYYIFEAAPLYSRATGDPSWQARAVALADQIEAAYGPGKKTYVSGHEGMKMGLIKLFRETGDDRYWKLARFFLDERGQPHHDRSSLTVNLEYMQDHLPVKEQRTAVGHAVRATYLYTPLVDIAALSGDAGYEPAMDAIWEDAVGRKTSLIGGLGAVRFHEMFGEPYDLPNVSCWNETCAAFGNVLWNQRLFQYRGDAKYVDVLERSLYNNLLAGVSQSGDRFFYQNVLKSFGRYPRFEWINVPCCPPNVVRMLATLGGYIYAVGPQDLYVNLFIGSEGRAAVAGTPVRVSQETNYPWDGRVRIAVAPEKPGRFALRVRVPGWAQGRPLPSDLYTYANATPAPVTFTVNGEPAEPVMDKGYAVIDRRWAEGDVVELSLGMPVRQVLAHENVRETRGFVAFERGPLVFCAEGIDNAGSVLNTVVPEEAAFASEFRPDLLGGVQVVTGDARAIVRSGSGALEPAPRPLTLVPYYAWCNRDLGEMAVWLARSEDKVRVSPIVPPAPIRSVRQFGGIELEPTGYGDQNDHLSAVYDGFEPLSSADESQTYYRLRPPAGRPAWIEYAFARPTGISGAGAYFVHDRRFCRLPESWRIMARVGGAWREVKALGPYPVNEDAWSEIAFEPVTATAVRIEVFPKVIQYKAGEIGPPEAMFIDADIDWSEAGLIEFRVR